MEILILGLLVNIGISIGVAWAAGQRGRSTAGFFLLSAFFSFLVALLFLIALPSAKHESPDGLQEITRCPNCAENILLDASLCKHCGSDVSAHTSALRNDAARDFELEQLRRQQEDLLDEEAREDRQRNLHAKLSRIRSSFRKPTIYLPIALLIVGLLFLGVGSILKGIEQATRVEKAQAIARADADSRLKAFLLKADWNNIAGNCLLTN